MAAALNLSSTPFLRQIASTRTPKASMSVRATSRPSESLSTSTSVGTKENEDRGLSSSSSSSFSPPPNFKPPEPKRFGVRPDKVLDVLGASLSLIFRLGTGIFVDGYCQSLGEVVNRIYEKMDLLLFVDENKSTNHPLFSEDSNNSWRDNLLSDEVGDNYSSNDPVSVENKAHQNDNEKSPGLNNVYTSKLIKAQEMRERARDGDGNQSCRSVSKIELVTM